MEKTQMKLKLYVKYFFYILLYVNEIFNWKSSKFVSFPRYTMRLRRQHLFFTHIINLNTRGDIKRLNEKVSLIINNVIKYLRKQTKNCNPFNTTQYNSVKLKRKLLTHKVLFEGKKLECKRFPNEKSSVKDAHSDEPKTN